MITVLIAQDEERFKELLKRMLQQEGYMVPDNFEGGSVIRIIKKDSIKDMSVLKDTVIELEDSLYKEKQGTLYRSILDTIEKPLIEHVLERTEGNQLKAAKILGINRNTMHAKIKKLGIDTSRWKH